MSKTTTVSVALDQDAYAVFQSASEIVAKTGIRVPTSQLVQTMINAEMARLSARKIAHRFLKTIMTQLGASADGEDDDEDFPRPPALPRPPAISKPAPENTPAG